MPFGVNKTLQIDREYRGECEKIRKNGYTGQENRKKQR
jgi:hypothetical protein